MFFGLDIEKLLILGVVAAFLIGPQRLPAVAQYAARFIVRARKWADEAKQKVREELGDDMDDVQWRSLDPRQYDPRRIIRDALLSAPSPAVEENRRRLLRQRTQNCMPEPRMTEVRNQRASSAPARMTEARRLTRRPRSLGAARRKV